MHQAKEDIYYRLSIFQTVVGGKANLSPCSTMIKDGVVCLLLVRDGHYIVCLLFGRWPVGLAGLVLVHLHGAS